MGLPKFVSTSLITIGYFFKETFPLSLTKLVISVNIENQYFCSVESYTYLCKAQTWLEYSHQTIIFTDRIVALPRKKSQEVVQAGRRRLVKIFRNLWFIITICTYHRSYSLWTPVLNWFLLVECSPRDIKMYVSSRACITKQLGFPCSSYWLRAYHNTASY